MDHLLGVVCPWFLLLVSPYIIHWSHGLIGSIGVPSVAHMFVERLLRTSYLCLVFLHVGADAMKGLPYLLDKCEQLLAATPNSHMLAQFDNPFNPIAHYKGTGPEIWAATEGKLDIFVSTAGTGGTISGTGRYLKNQKKSIQVVAVEPAESPVLQGGEPGPHLIQGAGPGFIPRNTDASLFDEVVSVSGPEAIAAAKRLALEEGLIVGISSGCALAGALKVAKRPENAGKLIVTILPSGGERYLSTALFASIKEEVENLKFDE